MFESEADGSQPALSVGDWEATLFDHETLDFAGDFALDTFTAADSDLYQFGLLIDFTTWDKDASDYELHLVISNRTYEEKFTTSVLSERLPVRISIVANMDASDTAFCRIRQNGGRQMTVIKAGSFLKGRRIDL